MSQPPALFVPSDFSSASHQPPPLSGPSKPINRSNKFDIIMPSRSRQPFNSSQPSKMIPKITLKAATQNRYGGATFGMQHSPIEVEDDMVPTPVTAKRRKISFPPEYSVLQPIKCHWGKCDAVLNTPKNAIKHYRRHVTVSEISKQNQRYSGSSDDESDTSESPSSHGVSCRVSRCSFLPSTLKSIQSHFVDQHLPRLRQPFVLEDATQPRTARPYRPRSIIKPPSLDHRDILSCLISVPPILPASIEKPPTGEEGNEASHVMRKSRSSSSSRSNYSYIPMSGTYNPITTDYGDQPFWPVCGEAFGSVNRFSSYFFLHPGAENPYSMENQVIRYLSRSLPSNGVALPPLSTELPGEGAAPALLKEPAHSKSSEQPILRELRPRQRTSFSPNLSIPETPPVRILHPFTLVSRPKVSHKPFTQDSPTLNIGSNRRRELRPEIAALSSGTKVVSILGDGQPSKKVKVDEDMSEVKLDWVAKQYAIQQTGRSIGVDYNECVSEFKSMYRSCISRVRARSDWEMRERKGKGKS